MGQLISVRLDEEIQATLETAAHARGIGLSAYLRELADSEARRLRRERIRAQSRAVAEHVASKPDAVDFYADWGTPNADEGPI